MKTLLFELCETKLKFPEAPNYPMALALWPSTLQSGEEVVGDDPQKSTVKRRNMVIRAIMRSNSIVGRLVTIGTGVTSARARSIIVRISRVSMRPRSRR